MNARIISTTLTAFQKRHDARRQAAIAAQAEATQRHGARILERAHANVPVATGHLDDTLHTEAIAAVPGRTEVDVVAATPYALAVHNRPDSEDQAHADEVTPEGHRGAGFLSRPVRFQQQTWLEDTLDSVMRALGGTN